MKKTTRVLLVFALFAPIFCAAQQKISHGLALGIFGNHLVYENNGDPLPDSDVLFGGQSAQEKTSFSLGYRVGIHRGKWVFQSGLQSRTAFFKVTCDCSTWPSEYDPNAPGLYSRDPKLDDVATSRFVFLEIPLLAKRFLTGKGRLSIDFGVLPAVELIKNRGSKTILPHKKDATEFGFFQKKLSARAGMSMKFSKKMNLGLFLSHDFGSFDLEGTSIKAKRNSIGLELGYAL